MNTDWIPPVCIGLIVVACVIHCICTICEKEIESDEELEKDKIDAILEMLSIIDKKIETLKSINNGTNKTTKSKKSVKFTENEQKE